MTDASREASVRDRDPLRALTLPELGEVNAPAWPFIRNAVFWIILIFAGSITAVLVASPFITMHLAVDANGVLEPSAVWAVRAAHSGTIVQPLVHEGDDVKAGQTLADLAASCAGTDTSRQPGAAIVAPASGVVLTEQIAMRTGTPVTAGQVLMEIGDRRRWRALLHVRERDVYQIHVGNRVDISIPALASTSAHRTQGVVASIAWQAIADGGQSVNSSKQQYAVSVLLDTVPVNALPRDALRRGYSVHGKIITQSGSAAWILWQRLRQRAQGGAS